MASRQRAAQALELKIVLQETDPPIWRRVLVATSTTLHGLHRIIQLLMGWYDYHLYEFVVRDRQYQAPDAETEGEDATCTTLRALHLKKGERFTYLYDFGDDWLHEILVEHRRRPSPDAWLPWVLGGERAAPPEDAGGTYGFGKLLKVLANPKHPEHESYRTWAGRDYDPKRFDLRTVRHAVIMAAAWGALEGSP